MNALKLEAGDNIVWKGNGTLFSVLSTIVSWKEPSWKARKWKGWHMGYIIRILDSGEIITSQAIANGVSAVTYPDFAAMGDCHIYHWLDNPDQAKIDLYASEHNEDKYDIPAYFWTIIAYLFNLDFAIFTKREDCWENVSRFDRFIGKELQLEDKMPLISDMMNVLEQEKQG